MMTDVLHITIICVALVLGWTIATNENMFLHKARVWAEEKKEKWKLIEPVFLCHWCMPSSWALIAYLFAYVSGVIHGGKILLLYPIVVCLSSMACGLIWQLYQLLDIMTKYYINAEKEKYFEVKDRKEKYRAKSNG